MARWRDRGMASIDNGIPIKFAPHMPSRFEPLATYNAECGRGIVHTPDWDARMAILQREFHEWRDITEAPSTRSEP